MRQLDGVLADVPLVLQRRQNVDGCIGDDDRPGVGRHRDQKAVAEAAFGAQAALLLHHLVQQLVGVQAALHQRLRLAGVHHLHGDLRGVVAVFGRDKAIGGDVDTVSAATARIFFPDRSEWG